MNRPRGWSAMLALAFLVAGCGGGGGKDQANEVAPFTMVIGIDASGSFRDAHLYDDAVEFGATYIYAHLNGLGGLRPPSALFVSSIGGARPREAQAVHPVHTFQGRTAGQMHADIPTRL